MRKSFAALLVAALLVVPVSVSAQGFGIAGRAGTLGLGAEAALGLSPNFALRGGIGLLPFEPSATIDDIDFTMTLPDTWYNIGADLYLAGGFRVGGGMLFKPDDPTLEGTIASNVEVEIGDQTYRGTEVSTLNGVLDSKDSAPYVLLGFGRHTRSGIGLFVDLGVAFLGEPEVRLSADGNQQVVNSAEFQAELRRQEQRTEDDAGSYLKLWPILNVGLKIGLGS